MPHDPYQALYLHIPFCVKRCNYCDFTTRAVAADAPEIDEYVDNLVLEIFRKSKERELGAIETVYVGGGTPSYLGKKRLSSLLYALSIAINMAKDGFECTMEANPESVDARLVHDIWALGVNRLSMGVQSFDDRLLEMLGRAHTADGAARAVACACERFDNVSVDLMCGIPGQSDEVLARSVARAVELGVNHVSIYPLTIEDATPFGRAVLRGQMDAVDDDDQARQMQVAEEVLVDAGFSRYEVASYARPGYACKHNLAYWSGVPYLGIGRSAATMTQNDERRMRTQDGRITDDLTRPEMEAEDLMLAMRTSRGISNARLEQARPWLPDLDETVASLAERGLVEVTPQAVVPTERGWLLGNEVFEAFFALA